MTDSHADNDPGARRRAFVWIIIGYVITIAASVGAAIAWPGDHGLLVRAIIGDLVGTVVIFGFSFAFKNSSFYDAYWSVAPIVLAFGWMAALVLADATPPIARAVPVLLLVTAYGVRLTWNWARGWTGFDHEDWRYVNIREATGPLYWLVSFLGIHLFPTVQVFLGMLPVYFALTVTDRPFGVLDVVAIIVTGGAILIEGTADDQLRRFRLTNTEPKKILDTGLWRYSRHPNYFGEASFWWGLALFGVAAAPNEWWNLAGAVAITVMFVTVSIPMIDKRMLERRPHYAERKKKVSALIPWFPRS